MEKSARARLERSSEGRHGVVVAKHKCCIGVDSEGEQVAKVCLPREEEMPLLWGCSIKAVTCAVMPKAITTIRSLRYHDAVILCRSPGKHP